jgi:hypothetical protein
MDVMTAVKEAAGSVKATVTAAQSMAMRAGVLSVSST